MQFLKPSLIILKKYYDEPGKNLKLILSRELDKISDQNQRQAVTRTVYEVVRHQRLLDYIIRKFSQRKLKKIQPDIRLLLKIGTYLLIFSQSYPDYAVVNEVVKAVKTKAKGFVNALLRNIAANKTNIHKDLENITQPDIAYSISNELIDGLRLISSHLEKDLKYLNQQPLFHIRVNPKKTTFAEAKQLLEDHNIPCRELVKFQSFEIKETGQVINRLMGKKMFYFQDTGSQLISIIAARFAPETLLDCCAAPGTKSVTLSLLNPQITIYANDINPKRTKLMKNFLDQYELTRIRPLVSDIKHPGFKKDVDFIVVDAPCTSSGTLRKNPDLKMKIDSDLINRNAKNQYEIMASIITRFSKSAYVLYSVCSFLKEESEDVMERLFHNLSLADRYEGVDLTALLEEYGFNYRQGKYGCYLLPGDSLQNDLFYISLLKNHF